MPKPCAGMPKSWTILVLMRLNFLSAEYLVRGGAMTVKESDLWSPTRMVVIRFADAATANRFYDSAEYQAILPISKESARRTGFVVEGV